MTYRNNILTSLSLVVLGLALGFLGGRFRSTMYTPEITVAAKMLMDNDSVTLSSTLTLAQAYDKLYPDSKYQTIFHGVLMPRVVTFCRAYDYLRAQNKEIEATVYGSKYQNVTKALVTYLDARDGGNTFVEEIMKSKYPFWGRDHPFVTNKESLKESFDRWVADGRAIIALEAGDFVSSNPDK